MSFWLNSKHKEYYGENGGFLKSYIDSKLKKHREENPIDHPDGSVTDEKLGERTVTIDGTAVTGKLTSVMQKLADKIIDVLTDCEKKDADLLDIANTEQAARINADNSLTSRIDSETSSRQSADNALRTSINAEVSNRQSADNALQASINTEVSNRQSADNALRESINDKADASHSHEAEDISGVIKKINGISPDDSGNILMSDFAEMTHDGSDSVGLSMFYDGEITSFSNNDKLKVAGCHSINFTMPECEGAPDCLPSGNYSALVYTISSLNAVNSDSYFEECKQILTVLGSEAATSDSNTWERNIYKINDEDMFETTWVDRTDNLVSALEYKVDKVSGKGLSSNDYTTADKNKLAGIAAGAQVNTVTGVKGNSESNYRTGNISITKANIGLGNVDNTSDANKPISTAVQNALNGKQASITGGASSITSSNLTANRALIANSTGKVAVSPVTSTELGYLEGVTGNIQTQLNRKNRTTTLVVGTSASGHTASEVDYLCDGTADNVEINNAISALPDSGGKIVLLDGTYNIASTIYINKSHVTVQGMGNGTVLKRMFNDNDTWEDGVIKLDQEDCIVSDLFINGNRTSYTDINNKGVLIFNNTAKYNVISNIKVRESSLGIVLGGGAEFNFIKGNTVANLSQQGIYVYFSTYNHISGNTVIDTNYGISMEWCAMYNIIGQNQIFLPRNTGICISGNSSRQVIIGNHILSSNSTQHTINNASSSNIITSNMVIGKDVTNSGDSSNIIANNRT